MAKDNLMGGMVKGKSDPYVKINIGGVTFKSHVIKENLNPTWNEMYEVCGILAYCRVLYIVSISPHVQYFQQTCVFIFLTVGSE